MPWSILFSYLLTSLIYLPVLVAYLVGLVLAIINLKRNKTPALLALIAFALLFLLWGVQHVIQPAIPQIILSRGAGFGVVTTVNIVLGLCDSIFITAGVVLLILAIFGKRKKTGEEPPVV